MKIAHVLLGYHPMVGGVGRHVATFLHEMRKSGHTVDIITTDWAPASYGQEKGVIRLRTGLFRRSTGLSNYLNRYDIVHVHGYQTFQPYQVVKIVSGKIPVVFTPHYHPFGKRPWLVRKAFDMLFGAMAMKQADRIIVQSPFEKESIVKFGVEDKIRLIPAPIADGYFRIKGRAKREKGVLYVGRIERYKGLEYLVKAFEISKVQGSRLIVVGKDYDGTGAKLKDYVKNKFINASFVESISDAELVKLYQRFSTLVLPSKYENIGLVLLEAMTQKMPVIGSNTGGIPFVLGYGKAGMLVPYGNVRILAEKIEMLLADRRLAESFGKAGYKQAKKFRASKLSKELEKVYEELLTA